MDISKLFKIQKELDEHIEQKHPRFDGEDRLSKKILSLLVELGELANEQRSWKFWSEDQEPRTTLKCWNCSVNDTGYFSGYEWTGNKEVCKICSGTGINKSKNPLLEEYMDGLHFILSIALEIGLPQDHPYQTYEPDEGDTITSQFQRCFVNISDYVKDGDPYEIMQLITDFGTLGEMLGFTWEEVEQAYLEKNKVNHARQENGY